VLSASAKSGKIGDGKIFVSTIDDVIRIRNGDRGEAAL
jgi:nitrogen regulatory protein P-II 1